MTNNNVIGIIAGDGLLPDAIINSCLKNSLKPFVVYVDREPSLIEVPNITVNIASIGKTIKWLKQNNVEQILFIGKTYRPKWSSLRPDLEGIKLLSRLTKSFIQGDNALLSIMLAYFEEHGFKILKVADVAPELIISIGNLSSISPDKHAVEDIEFASKLLSTLSPFDIGQSVIVQNKVVLGLEAVEGTDGLIKRCKDLKQDNKNGPILVKRKKDKQDIRIDLPTIGPSTIDNAYEAKIQGIALQAGFTIIIDADTVKRKLDEYKMFLVGTR